MRVIPHDEFYSDAGLVVFGDLQELAQSNGVDIQWYDAQRWGWAANRCAFVGIQELTAMRFVLAVVFKKRSATIDVFHLGQSQHSLPIDDGNAFVNLVGCASRCLSFAVCLPIGQAD